MSDGETPLEVMLDNMRFYHRRAGEVLAKLLAEGAPQPEVAEGANVIEAVRDAHSMGLL